MQNTKQIDLQELLTNKESEVLAGNERGKYYRDKFALDLADNDEFLYDVLVPDRISAMNLSFFLSMFGESIIKLGQSKFSEKYRFQARPTVLRTVQQGVSRAMKTMNLKNSA
jgi:hypothetical protein